MALLTKQPSAHRGPPKAVEIVFVRACMARDTDDDTPMEHREAGDVRTVLESVALELVAFAGAALYAKAGDDPSPQKAYTITDARKAALAGEVRMREDARALKAQQAQDAAEEAQYARAVRRELIARHKVA